MVNVLLGAPYEGIIQKFIEKGYASSCTEVIRQALMSYDRLSQEEEARQVHKAVEAEMQKIKSGQVKTIPLQEIEKKYGKSK